MRLNRIEIKNFKGIESFVADFDGQNARVMGANATGKTSLFDAYMWCLTGKDSLGQADFQIKRIDADGEAHNLEHMVHVTLNINGEEKRYGRIYKEKWTKKRGSSTAEFTGHTTDYQIDGLPAKMKEFDADVTETLVEPGLFWVLTCPMYFSNAMPWQQRRELLFALCDDVSELDIIAGDPTLKPLVGIIKKDGQIGVVRKKIAADKKAVNDELQHIPVRVDELLNQIVVVKGIEDVTAIKKEIADLMDKLASIESAGARQTIQVQIDKLVMDLAKARYDIQGQQVAVETKYQAKIKDVNGAIETLERELAQVKADVESHTRNISDQQQRLQELRGQYAELVARKIQVDDVCPTCAQPMPRERIAEAVARLQRDKQRAIDDNKTKGLETKSAHEKSVLARDAAAATHADLLSRLNALYEQMGDLKDNYDAEMPGMDNDDTLRMVEEIAQLKIKLAQDAPDDPQRQQIMAQVAANDTRLDAANRAQAAIDQNEKLNSRVAELESREKALSSEYDRLEQLSYLIELLIKTKIDRIEAAVNDRFLLVNFKLFSEQINGGVKECCEATVNGVPYSSINHAGRIQAGMDIINTLQDAHGISVPIWVDGRESVIELMPTVAQTISLVVSEAHEQIVVQIDK